MPYNRKLIYLLTIGIIILILTLAFVIFKIIPDNKSAIENSNDQQPSEIVLNNKNIKNPTFDDLGYYLSLENHFSVIVKLLDIERKGDETYLIVQLNENPKNIQYILVQNSSVIKSTLINLNNDNYIFSNNQGDVLIAKSNNELEDRLKKYLNKNILLNVYTDSKTNSLNKYIECNRKLLFQFKQKDVSKLSCSPAVWDITVYDK